MKYTISILLLVGTWVIGTQLMAQTEDGLVSYISFDGCQTEDMQGFFTTMISGSPQCVCGAEGDALEFNGVDDAIVFGGDYSRTFLGDFTLSFYFLPKSSSPNQDLMSFRVGCNIDSVLAISYDGTSREVQAVLRQNVNRNAFLTHTIDETACWQHVVIVKNDKTLFLFINGVLVQEEVNSQIIGVQNQGSFGVSNSPCIGLTEERFAGVFDEMRFYNRALPLREVLSLYTRPDNIINKDTTILLGDVVDIESSESCATTFTWSPSAGVSNPAAPSVQLTPSQSATYTLTYNLETCSTQDQITITVVDPEILDCNQVFIPEAFTPNGDGLNEVYGISNPYVFDRLISFEIFSAWGEKLFNTSDAFGTWDGNYRGEPVNPGVYVYKLAYICSGEEFSKTGSVSLLR